MSYYFTTALESKVETGFQQSGADWGHQNGKNVGGNRIARRWVTSEENVKREGCQKKTAASRKILVVKCSNRVVGRGSETARRWEEIGKAFRVPKRNEWGIWHNRIYYPDFIPDGGGFWG